MHCSSDIDVSNDKVSGHEVMPNVIHNNNNTDLSLPSSSTSLLKESLVEGTGPELRAE